MTTTIPAMVQAAAVDYAGLDAVIEGDQRWDYAELGRRVETAIRAAIGAGITPGDRVAIWAPNTRQWILAALGALGAGGIIVPLNTRYKGAEAGYILTTSRAQALFCVTEFLGTDYVAALREALGGSRGSRPVAGLPALERIVVMDGPPTPATVSWDEFLGDAAEVSVDTALDRINGIDTDDVSDILFTSGTTGKPKGAKITHGQTLRVFSDWTDIIGLRAKDRYLIVNPFFHVFGYKAGFVSAILRGAAIIPMPVFDVDQAMTVIERERVTVLPGPPTIHQAILNHPHRDRYDLSSLRLCATGSSDVPVAMIRRMHDELSYETIVTGYGLTECTGTATMCRYDDDAETIARTSGRALPDVDVRIVDDDLLELPVGEPGEIVVRGYNVMSGYFDDPAATAETITEDGWLRTGDLGVMDERGYVTITGRKKDMFIVGGFNTYPAEIEDTLLGHPAVAQVAVVGVPDERLGEVGMAYVVVREGMREEAAALIKWARERLANYKVPRYVEFVQELPTNAAGKVLKHELRNRSGRLA